MTKKLKLIIIVSSVVLLIGIGLTIYFVSSDDDLVDCSSRVEDFVRRYCDADGNEVKRAYYNPSSGEWVIIYIDADGNPID